MRCLSSYLLLPLTLVLSGAVLASCAKIGGKESVSENKVRLSIEGVFSDLTKAEPSDSAVLTLDVFVFCDGGTLEAYRRVNGSSADITVTAGRHYTWHVVANAPENAFSEVASETQFLSSVWTLDGIGSGYPMVGSGDGVLDKNSEVEVSLTRMVSKVVLKSVTPSFLGKTFKGSVAKIEKVYLINVVGSCPYSGTPSAGSLWYNRLALEQLPSGLSEYLSKSFSFIVEGDGKVSVPCSFICCPNPVDNGVTSLENPDWSERNTRLVIELSIDGVMNYYPIDMPSMACNNTYILNEVILKGPGSSNPDIPVNRSAVSFTVSVNPWDKDDEKTLEF